MPLYEYQCQSCGHRFELMQKFSDPAPSECPSCSAQSVRKLVSNTSFQLKGSGWYLTDYGKGGSAAASKSGDGKSAESKSGDDKTSDSKSGESKSGESKSSESKSSESKSSDNKPASTGA
ncbi:MAG: FmdB family zinc ribbon protein [Myxococcota bacterium]